MNRKTKNIRHLLNREEIEVENIKVEFRYAKSNKQIDECMLKVLKRKNGGN